MPSLTLVAQATGLQGISDGSGVAIAVTGMLIVFLALIGISLFISALPHALRLLDPFLPEESHRHGPPPSTTSTDDSPSQEVVAAIGFALHQEAAHQDSTQRSQQS